MRKEQLPIASPCTEDWDAMEGDDHRRQCQKCDKEVVNLSTLTAPAVARLLRRTGDRELCVRYSFDDAGNVELRKDPGPPLIPAALLLRGREALLGASLAAAALTGCNPAGPAGDALLAREALRGAAQKLAQSGTCSVSMEPLLPMELRLHAAPCVPQAAVAPLLPKAAPPAPVPVPVPVSPKPATPEPAPPASESAPPSEPAPRSQPTKQPCHQKDQKPSKYPHKLMGKPIMPRTSSLLD